MKHLALPTLLLVIVLAACSSAAPDAPGCEATPWGSVAGSITGPMLGGAPIRLPPIDVQLQPAQASECVRSATARTAPDGSFSFDHLPADVSFMLHVATPDSLMLVPEDSARQVTVAAGALLSLPLRLQFAPHETTLSFYVAPQDAACNGPFPRRCLLVKEHPADPYRLFYDGIQGFTWEAGYEYQVRVVRSRAPSVPADGGLYVYRLLELVSRTPA